MHKVKRDRFVALWVLKVRALGAEETPERRDSVVCGGSGLGLGVEIRLIRPTKNIVGDR